MPIESTYRCLSFVVMLLVAAIALPAGPAPQAVESTPVEWSAWLDRDDPSGTADSEALVHFLDSGDVWCERPVDIECQTLSGDWWWETGEVFRSGYDCVRDYGLKCYNIDQPDGSCQDYRVRFACPAAIDNSYPYPNPAGESSNVKEDIFIASSGDIESRITNINGQEIQPWTSRGHFDGMIKHYGVVVWPAPHYQASGTYYIHVRLVNDYGQTFYGTTRSSLLVK